MVPQYVVARQEIYVHMVSYGYKIAVRRRTKSSRTGRNFGGINVRFEPSLEPRIYTTRRMCFASRFNEVARSTSSTLTNLVGQKGEADPRRKCVIVSDSGTFPWSGQTHRS
jgi:hypothetical protein